MQVGSDVNDDDVFQSNDMKWQALQLIELAALVVHEQQLCWQPGSLPTELSGKNL